MAGQGRQSLGEQLYYRLYRAGMAVVEANWVPDFLLRAEIRRRVAGMCRALTLPGEAHQARLQAFVDELKGMPVAVQTAAANEQHYEVPTEYFLLALGPRLKYSSCFYASPRESLGQAEEAMLALTCERAELAGGQSILELGCGWGSLTLYMASRFPDARVTAVSNSRTQKQFIDAQARERGLTNVTVVTADMVGYDAGAGRYDRVVSVEMFEHMKNYQTLLGRVARWLRPGGKCFLHIFVHRGGLPWHYEVAGEDDWMAKYFFSGGTMPSHDLLLYFQDDLAVQRQWYVNGEHYSRTLEAWLARQDAARGKVMPIFERCYGRGQALRWWVYWRLFYLACSELFAFQGGERFGVGHYLFTKKA